MRFNNDSVYVVLLEIDSCKGIGVGLTKKIDFLYFDICCSPIFLLSKMGSFVALVSILMILWAFP